MNAFFEKRFSARLEERKLNGNLRELRVYGSGLDFFSNDYLSWGINGITDTYAEKYLSSLSGPRHGSGGSRLISGNSIFAEDLEQRIAALHKAEAAIVFPNGYSANLGLIQSASERHTTLVCDELCHASILDACTLATKKAVYKFDHNNPDALEAKLQRIEGASIVIVESLYSMDGDVAPLEEIVSLCRKYGAALIVDEAHALGVFGKEHTGIIDDERWNDVLIGRIYTYGKAMAAHGASVVCSTLVKQLIVNFSRPFIYSTAPPLHQLAAIAGAYDALEHEKNSVEKLQSNIRTFQLLATKHGLTSSEIMPGPIQRLKILGNEKAKAMAAHFQQESILIKAILHPTVAKGEERIRICLHANHTEDQIEFFFNTLNSLQ